MNSVWFIVILLSRIWSCSLSDRSIPLLNYFSSILKSSLFWMVTIIVYVNCTITMYCMNKGFLSITIIVSIRYSSLLSLSDLDWVFIINSRSVYWECFIISDWLEFVNCARSCILNSFFRTKMCFGSGRINNFRLTFMKVLGWFYLSPDNIPCISNFFHFIGIFCDDLIKVICSYRLRYRSWIKSYTTIRCQFNSFSLWRVYPRNSNNLITISRWIRCLCVCSI